MMLVITAGTYQGREQDIRFGTTALFFRERERNRPTIFGRKINGLPIDIYLKIKDSFMIGCSPQNFPDMGVFF